MEGGLRRPGHSQAEGFRDDPEGKAVQRALFHFPAWTTMAASVRASALRAGRAFEQLSVEPRMPPRPGSLSERPSLAHPLANWMIPSEPGVAEARAAEGQIAASASASFHAALNRSSPQAFIKALEEIGSRLLGEPTAIRASGAATIAGGDGRYVRYPSPDTILARLDELHAVLQRSRGEPPVFSAALALVAITNCHPFKDGNGRVARIVFNLVLWGGDGKGPYIPLYDLGNRPWGSLTLFMRAAELHEEWEELFEFLVAAFEVSRMRGADLEVQRRDMASHRRD